jgi:DNA polymerase phi
VTRLFRTQCITQQLERRDPAQEDEDEEMEDEGAEGDSDSESEDGDGDGDGDGDEEDEEPDLELRSKIEEALRASGIEPADDSEGEDDSEEEEVMDDDQMMAIDDQLAEIFRSRASEKRGGKGAEFRRCCYSPFALIHDFFRRQCPTRGYSLQEPCS